MFNPKTKFEEMMKLIAQYDWAVEGFPAPEGVLLSREDAVTIRNGLVTLTKEIA